MSDEQFILKKKERKFRSKAEKTVVELLEWKHPVPVKKWPALKPSELTILRKIVRKKNHPWRGKAIHAFVMTNHKDHVKEIENIISNKRNDKTTRAVGIICLGMSKNKDSEKILLKYSRDRDDFLRAKVVESLGKVGTKNSFEFLELSLNDKSPLVRKNTLNSIKNLKKRLRIS